jgi:hypothetical protein
MISQESPIFVLVTKLFSFQYPGVLIFCCLLLIPGSYLSQNYIWQQKVEFHDQYTSSFLDFRGDVMLMQYSATFDTLSVTKRSSQNGTEVWHSDLIWPAGNVYKGFQGVGDLSGNVYILEFRYNTRDTYGSARVYKLNSSGKLQWIKHLDSTRAYGPLYVDHVGTVHVTINNGPGVNIPQTTSEISFDPATGNTSAIKTLFTKANSVSNAVSDDEGNLCFIGYAWIGCSRVNGTGTWRIEPGIYPTRMCPDHHGNLYVTGYFTNNVVCGSGRYIDTLEFDQKSNENGASYFVMKIRISTGEIRWAKKIRTGDLSFIRGLYVDQSDNFFAYGAGGNYPDSRVYILNFNSVNGAYKVAGSVEEGTNWLEIDQSDHLIGLQFVRTPTEDSYLLAKRGPIAAIIFPDNRISIEIMPNPFERELTLYLNKIAPGTYQLELIDASGKKVLSMRGDQEEANLDLQWLQSGLYILSLTESNGNQTVKKIVKKEL